MTTARLFKNGRSQAVWLPAEFRFEGDEVSIRRDPATGDVILSPLDRTLRSWLQLHERLLPNIPAEELDAFMADRHLGLAEADGIDNLPTVTIECADAVRPKPR